MSPSTSSRVPSPRSCSLCLASIALLSTRGLTLEALKKRFSDELLPLLVQGKSVALVVRKGSFAKGTGTFLFHEEELGREEAIASLAQGMGPDDFVVSTTGKISRELFEYCKNSKPANFLAQLPYRRFYGACQCNCPVCSLAASTQEGMVS